MIEKIQQKINTVYSRKQRKKEVNGSCRGSGNSQVFKERNGIVPGGDREVKGGFCTKMFKMRARVYVDRNVPVEREKLML